MSKKTTEELYEEIFNKMYNDYSTEGYIGFLKFFEQENICEPASREQFINKCKKDLDFAKYWGLKIEERELSLEERHELALPIWKKEYGPLSDMMVPTNVDNTPFKIPTKLITITYKNEIMEVYE